MSIEAMNWAYQQTTGRSTAKAVLVALANQSDPNGKCWPSIEYVAQRVEITPRAVMTNIAYLQELGLVERERRGGDGSGRKTNVYRLKMQREGNALSPPNVNEVHEGQRERNDTKKGGNVNEVHQQRERGSPKQSKNNQLKKNNQKTIGEIPPYLNPEMWADWVAYRKSIKKPINETTFKHQLREMEKLHAAGHDVNACISQSIANGWQGLFPPKQSSHNPRQSKTGNDEFWSSFND